MQEIFKESLRYLFYSIFASMIFAPIMISILYKFNQVSGITKTKLGLGEGTNSVFMKIMKVGQTNGTPNMGGIMIWLIIPLITYLTLPMTPVLEVFLIGFLLFGFWGFIDVAIFTNGFKNNEQMRTLQETFEWRLGKVIIAVLLNTFVAYLLYMTGEFTDISLFNIITIAISPAMLLLIGIVGQFAIYSGELTDGLDGLMIGIFTIITFSMSILLLVQGQYEFLPVLGIMLGAQIVDLYFNIPPARFWNGGPGAMPLAFAIFYIGLVTDNIIPYFIITSITWGIMASSAIQIISMKFFKKRVFKIAPIHHHFQAIGWPQYKVTMRFWLITILTGVIGIYIGLL